MDLISFLLYCAGISTSAKGYYNSDIHSRRRADRGLNVDKNQDVEKGVDCFKVNK